MDLSLKKEGLYLAQKKGLTTLKYADNPTVGGVDASPEDGIAFVTNYTALAFNWRA